MNKLWIAAIALAWLAGCAAPDVAVAPHPHQWNGGVWNSVLGYHGPTNAILIDGPQ